MLVRPGTTPNANQVNAVAKQAAMQADPQSASSSEFIPSPGGFAVHDYTMRPHWAKITGGSGNRYSHISVDTSDPDAVAEHSEDSPFYIAGETDSTPAVEVNGSESVPTDAIVYLVPNLQTEQYDFSYVAPAMTAGFTLRGVPSGLSCDGSGQIELEMLWQIEGGSNITVSGIVYDASDNPLSGVDIYGSTQAINAGRAMTVIDTTDGSGAFSGVVRPFVDEDGSGIPRIYVEVYASSTPADFDPNPYKPVVASNAALTVNFQEL